jgi:hypothetical protein
MMASFSMQSLDPVRLFRHQSRQFHFRVLLAHLANCSCYLLILNHRLDLILVLHLHPDLPYLLSLPNHPYHMDQSLLYRVLHDRVHPFPLLNLPYQVRLSLC